MGKHLTRFAVGTVAAAVALALAGCGSDKAQPPSSVRTTSTVASPTSTPTPTAPVMPDAAKQHTKEGAEAFVRYFWDVANAAQSNGDPSELTDLSLDGCEACDGTISSIRKTKAAGGTYVGGTSTVVVQSSELLQSETFQMAHVQARIDVSDETVDYPGSGKDVHRPARQARIRMELTWAGGWRVAQIVAVA
ncbi:DUF6318 family protein [Nocardioides sp. Kera G14]|uniref:DUF6318 family protein n=1 Tax=Nocardioides sp. Kera G14 TaxID=2884264 RepID=UPI001D10208A|nr:DUF6318 family protein [Nocardioides sp. Kera G14]UDY22462.1 DUF6318 family protein [Nocardioides sp. Kera G14]